MSGEIFRIPDRSERTPGRPRTVEIRGSSQIPRGEEPKIVGASVAGPTEIVDRHIPSDMPQPDVHVHDEVIVEGQDKVRSPDTANPQIELRVRTGGRESFERAIKSDD